MARKVEKTERYLNTRHAGLTGLLLLCGLLLTLAPTARAQAATSTTRWPVVTLTVTTLTDDAKTPAPGSLRYQVNRANAASSPARILFDPALSGGTITLTKTLVFYNDIQLLAQDTQGRSIDMTLDGGASPDRVWLGIYSGSATVSGFNLVNFGLSVSRHPAAGCTEHDVVKSRVTISDNVIVATSTKARIWAGTSVRACLDVTISGNRITAYSGIRILANDSSRIKATVSANTITGTTGATGDGISISTPGDSSKVEATVSANTITGATGNGIGIYTHGDSSRVEATVSANTITGAIWDGIGIYMYGDSSRVEATVSANTITDVTFHGIYIKGGYGTRVEATVSANTITDVTFHGIYIKGGYGTRVDATLSDNRITGARHGINLLGGSGRGRTVRAPSKVTVRGSGNTVIGSGGVDIFAADRQVGTDDNNEVNGRLENTIFNTKNLSGVRKRTNRFTVHRYQAATLPSGGLTGGYQNQDGTTEVVTIPTIEETYLSAPAQVAPRQAVERAVAVVSRQATSTDFGATPLVVSLIPRDADGRVVSGVADHPVRVCLPLPVGLSDAPTPQLAWLDGPVWHPLSSKRSEGQICADFRGFPLFLGSTGVPDTPDSTGGPGNPDGGTTNPDAPDTPDSSGGPGNPDGGTTNPGGPGNPAPPQRQAADAEATARGTESAGSSAPLDGHPPLVGVLENPRPASSQSGIGLISGWVCAGAVVELEVDGTPLGAAASGTSRADVAATGACGGRADVGFGLLFNWNLLGDGQHTIRALADGVEFSQATFTVTTLGEEFVHEGSGTALVADFPSPGEQARLVWQAGLQNFMLAPLSAPAARLAGGPAPAPAGGPLGVLENPAGGSFQSGLSVLSGWVCEATVVEVELNGDSAHRLAAAYGTGRADTADACGNAGSNGFGLLFNWNLLGDGVHTVRVLADGVEFGRATFTVTTFGEEFVREARGRVVVADFPSPGETATLAWQEATQTFVITHLE